MVILMQRTGLYICLLLASVCIVLRGDGNPLIKPKQLMIGTVVDTTNLEIVRDAVMMMKTMRMYGGAVNEATLIVGVTGQCGSNADNTVMATAAALGAQVILIPQSPAGQAKTLNKFRLFEAFDAIAFDYFLWLDADLVFFADPMPFLHMHHYPGSIECVPDFYNYMQRYPSINGSAEYWNAEFPAFHLLGAGETAPHGICNTGMLYFDSQSLSRFNARLQTILQNTTYLSLHAKDRFVDSLIFTEIVNTAGIEVTILPHALNYMALFEIEIQEELIPEDIVLAHMLSDTELFCTATAPTSTTEDAACTCTYRNKLMSPSGSKLRDTIQRKFLSDPAVCRMLASDSLPTTWPGRIPRQPATSGDSGPEVVRGDVAADGSIEERSVDCALVSPPPRDVTFHIGVELIAQVEVVLHCTVRAAQSANLDLSPQVEFVNVVRDASSMQNLYRSRVATPIGSIPTSRPGVREFEVAYTVQFQPALPTSGSDYAARYALAIEDAAHHVLATVHLAVLFDHLIPPGLVHYSSNPLLTAKPTALDSQLFLPEYLNDRRVRGTGVAVCCSTYKGLAVVERLMQHWQGDRLLILVDAVPALPAVNSASDPEQRTFDSQDQLLSLQQRLHATCRDNNLTRDRKLDCLIVAPPPAGALRDLIGPSHAHFIVSALRPRSVQFVYSGVASAAAAHSIGAALLRVLMQALVKNGLMIGTHYAPARRVRYPYARRGQEDSIVGTGVLNDTVVQVTATPRVPDMPVLSMENPFLRDRYWRALLNDQARVVTTRLAHARHAAETVASELGQNLQLTYAEREAEYCRVFVDQHATAAVPVERVVEWEETWRAWECAPAWFLHKVRGN